MDISKIIRERREILNITLKEIGDYVGVSEATVQRWESGNITNLRHGRIGKLAEVLQVSPGYLMGWDENTEMVEIGIPKAFREAFSKEEIEIIKIAKEAAAEGLTSADFREILRTLKKLKNNGK